MPAQKPPSLTAIGTATASSAQLKQTNKNTAWRGELEDQDPGHTVTRQHQTNVLNEEGLQFLWVSVPAGTCENSSAADQELFYQVSDTADITGRAQTPHSINQQLRDEQKQHGA